MSLLDTAIEFIAPGRMHRAAIPSLEAGLRPNTVLDTAPVLSNFAPMTADDICVWDSGFLVSHANDVSHVTAAGGSITVASLTGPVTALTATTDGALAAVAGEGISHVSYDGTVTLRWADERLRHNVTALAVAHDASVLVCVGSLSQDAWEQGLVRKVADGRLLKVAGDDVHVLADGLAWPAGVLPTRDGFMMSLSQSHRIEFRTHSGSADGSRAVLKNLPGYPGRLALSGDHLVATMPYMRNRAVELMLRDDALRTNMLERLEPDSWLIPRLGVTSEHRVPLQVGQIRVLGEIKPWAPPRTYGLAFTFTEKGLVTESVHSRADGSTHGITGIAAAGRQVALVSNGSGKVVSWKRN